MNIKNFYNPSDSRPWAKQPFNFNSKTIATNGHVLLIIDQDDKYDELPLNNNSIKQKISNILADIESVVFKEPPEITMPEKQECFQCRGSGKSKKVDCKECDSEGSVWFENEYNLYDDLECKSCFGDCYSIILNTENKCDDCNGLGKRMHPDGIILIDDVEFNANYIDLILNQPNLEISVSKENFRLLFKTSNSTGLIMGHHD